MLIIIQTCTPVIIIIISSRGWLVIEVQTEDHQIEYRHNLCQELEMLHWGSSIFHHCMSMHKCPNWEPSHWKHVHFESHKYAHSERVQIEIPSVPVW